jgi:hypothetical protein
MDEERTTLIQTSLTTTEKIVLGCDLAKRLFDPLQLLESMKAAQQQGNNGSNGHQRVQTS